jgi:hypothetical protein
MGDPNGIYYSETANPAIDAILDVQFGVGGDPVGKSWCLTNSCLHGYSGLTYRSPQFIHYVDSPDVTQRQGLFSKQRWRPVRESSY